MPHQPNPPPSLAQDQFPSLRPYKTAVVGGVCGAMALAGLPMTCPGGMYVFQLMDTYTAGYCMILAALVECLVVVYLYGLGNLLKVRRVKDGFESFLRPL